MKISMFIATLLFAIALAAPYDPKNHNNGHELEVSIREDFETVFVIMWYSSKAEDNVVDFNNKNKTEIQSKISGMDDVSWSMIDLGIDAHVDPENEDEDYSALFKTVNGEEYADKEEYLTKEGPIVNVIRKTTGVRISGKGIADEVADQIDEMREFIKEDASAASKKAAEEAEKAKHDISGSKKSSNDDSIDKATEPTQGEVDDIF